jgi:hypothetical protein
MLNTGIPVQDTVHEGAKLRTRFLKKEKFLPFGDHIASPCDLQILMSLINKGQHRLRETDIMLGDKMNYDSVERLCQPHIQNLLLANVPGKKKDRTKMFYRLKFLFFQALTVPRIT